MYSELLWGENYGDTMRVILWWTFYLRSETHPQTTRSARTQTHARLASKQRQSHRMTTQAR